MEQRLLGGKFSKDGAGAPNVNRGGVTRRTQEDLWSSVPQGHHLEHTEFSQHPAGQRRASERGDVKPTGDTRVSHTSKQRGRAWRARRPHLMGVDPDWNTKGSRQAKICQLDDALVVDEEVLGLEVPVQDAPAVTEVYSLQDLVQVALHGTKMDGKRRHQSFAWSGLPCQF